MKQVEGKASLEGDASLKWENCEEQIDLAALSLKEPILFYDEVCSLVSIQSENVLFSSSVTFICAF